MFLVRLSASGQVDWATNNDTPDRLKEIAFTNDNAIYLSGFTSASLPHLSRFDAKDGSMVWERTLEGGHFTSNIATDEQGNLFLLNRFFHTFDVDPGPGVHIINPTKNGIDMKNTAGMFVLKLNGNGEFDWAKVIQSGETPSSYFLSSDVAIDNRGNVLIAEQLALAAGNTNPQGIADPPPSATRLTTAMSSPANVPLLHAADTSTSVPLIAVASTSLGFVSSIQNERPRSNFQSEIDFKLAPLQNAGSRSTNNASAFAQSPSLYGARK